jgi:hypothetical protein
MTDERCRIPARLLLAAQIACAVTPLALAAGCEGGVQTSMQPDITVSQLAGTWTSPEGSGAITFHADHSFAATRLDLNGLFGQTCQPAASASGTWEFLSPDGDSTPNPEQYSSGYVIGLTFAGFNRTPTSSCASIWSLTQLTTWQINGPLGLCVDMDPDSPCIGEPWVWQKATRHG